VNLLLLKFEQTWGQEADFQ